MSCHGMSYYHNVTLHVLSWLVILSQRMICNGNKSMRGNSLKWRSLYFFQFKSVNVFFLVSKDRRKKTYICYNYHSSLREATKVKSPLISESKNVLRHLWYFDPCSAYCKMCQDRTWLCRHDRHEHLHRIEHSEGWCGTCSYGARPGGEDCTVLYCTVLW